MTKIINHDSTKIKIKIKKPSANLEIQGFPLGWVKMQGMGNAGNGKYKKWKIQGMERAQYMYSRDGKYVRRCRRTN